MIRMTITHTLLEPMVKLLLSSSFIKPHHTMTIEIMIRMTITHPLLEPMVNIMFQTWTAYLPRRPCQSPPPHTGKLFHPPHTDGRSFFKIVFIFLHFTQFCGIEIELFTITTEKNQPKLCRLKKSTKTLQVERCAGCARPCQASGRECVQLFL